MKSADIWGLSLIVIGMIVILLTYGVISISADLLKLLPGLVFIIIGIVILYFKGEESKIEKVKK